MHVVETPDKTNIIKFRQQQEKLTRRESHFRKQPVFQKLFEVLSINIYQNLSCALELNLANYRPQRSWGKVIFSEACVKNSVHGVVSRPTPGGEVGRGLGGGVSSSPHRGGRFGSMAGGVSRPTPGGSPGHTQGGSPGPHPGRCQGPGLGECISACTEADPSPPANGYCCGRYASYWNAFLF